MIIMTHNNTAIQIIRTSLPNQKVLDYTEAAWQHKINKSENIEICLWKGRKHCGKRRKCWLYQHFSPLSTMFSEGFRYRIIKKLILCGKEFRMYLLEILPASQTKLPNSVNPLLHNPEFQ